ncbi:MAG: hypothetical protein PHQ23_14005, partial [Candidatus Wallbacteria bacterium]|nr:hypothetical protein [Candidatus Wallbacteria bacterium]
MPEPHATAPALKPAVSSVTVETRLITGMTFGLIAPRDHITVRFKESQVDESQVGIDLKKSVFSFVPPISGSTSWKDSCTVAFRPDSPLKMRQKYMGVLDREALFPGEQMALKEIPFEFEVTGRSVLNLTGELSAAGSDTPSGVVLKGGVRFSENVELELLKNAIRLTENGQDRVLNVEGSSPGTEFNFVSEPFQREDDERELLLKISSSDLGLPAESELKQTVPSRKRFSVTGAADKVRGRKNCIEVNFSDELDQSADYRGFVKVEGRDELKLSANGKVLAVGGEFNPGSTWKVSVAEGLKNRWGGKTVAEWSGEISFPDIQPQILFNGDGFILPGKGRGKIAFRSVNLKRVDLRVWTVFENNICQFLQDNRLVGKSDRTEYFYNLERVGKVMQEKSLELGANRNEWLISEFDAAKLIAESGAGLFIFELSFGEDDILCGLPEDTSWYDFCYGRSRVFKPLLVSDLSLIAKRSRKTLQIYAVNLMTTEPVQGAEIRIRSYQNQLLDRKVTGKNGMVEFSETNVFFAEAEYEGQHVLLKFNDTELDRTLFDTGGVYEPGSGVRAFVYTDRGVYRPGEIIRLSMIVRNENDTFPPD